jgi:hypothetical protein
MIFAQINKQTKELKMFVGFQTEEMAESHFMEHDDCFFVKTNYFGSPSGYRFNQSTNQIEPKE